MNAADSWLRRRARRKHPLGGERETEEPPKPAPIVSAGVRSGGYPRRELTPDDLIRAVAGRSSAPGGWVRIA
jgi:hypothetical protein